MAIAPRVTKIYSHRDSAAELLHAEALNSFQRVDKRSAGGG